MKWLAKLNLFFKDLFLDEVDKEYDKPLPYHKDFGPKSIAKQKEILKRKRAIEQEQQNRGI